MSKEDLSNINKKLIEVLSKEKGYFGRIDTWGQRPTKYEYIGYELSEDFLPTLEKMSDEQKKNLSIIIMHFEIHAIPLKSMLKTEEGEHTLNKLWVEISWSQFMIVIMFGILELAIKGRRDGWLQSKRQKIVKFMEDNLSTDKKDDVTRRYKVEDVFKYEKEIKTFSDVIDHLWYKVRSGFIHDGGIESRGMEWTTLKGIGSKDNPITFSSEVPTQELLQITWQAILNSYGYKGALLLPKYKD